MILWLHECNRIFGDRLLNDADRTIFRDMIVAYAKEGLTENTNNLNN